MSAEGFDDLDRVLADGLGAIAPDVDLIDTRLVDSLGFVEFLLLLERLTGRPVDVESLDIDAFRSLSAIDRAFFSDASLTR